MPSSGPVTSSATPLTYDEDSDPEDESVQPNTLRAPTRLLPDELPVKNSGAGRREIPAEGDDGATLDLFTRPCGWAECNVLCT
ncbi:hypothetical protein B0H14DRAFT_3511784 [Mycena olivaceomarginata]|nr:hypothetical protein B0H14DRAFT_3511784 [Mycena olivaceomarginata]